MITFSRTLCILIPVYQISLRRPFGRGAYWMEGPTGQRGLLTSERSWPQCPPATPYAHVRGGYRISAREGRPEMDGLIWDGDGRFLTYADIFATFQNIHCNATLEWCSMLSLRPIPGTEKPCLQRWILCPRGGSPPQRPSPESAPACPEKLQLTVEGH